MSFENLIKGTSSSVVFDGFFTPAAAQAAGGGISDKPVTEKLMFESVSDDLIVESIANTAEIPLRSNAMAAVFAFAEEGMNTAEELDLMAVGMADLDDDGEVSDAEQDDYEESLNAIADALATAGVDPALITKALMDGDDDAAEEISLAVADFLDGLDDQDDYIASYSVREKLMLEAVKKVVRDGKVKWIKKPLRKKRMSPAQKAALKKARKKANTGAAKRARRKSMKIRKKVVA